MIVVDTNVLVYAVGRPHPLGALAADLLAFAPTGRLRVTARVLEEFAHTYAKRGRARHDAVAMVGEWSATLGPVELVAEEDLADGFDLWVQHPSLDLADGVLAAQARRLDAQLVSADAGFDEVAGLRFVHLADPDIHERLDLNQS